MKERKSPNWIVVNYRWNDPGNPMHQVEFEAKILHLTFYISDGENRVPFPVSREEAEEGEATGSLSFWVKEEGWEIYLDEDHPDYEILETLPTRRWRGIPTIVIGRPSDAKETAEPFEEDS